MCFGNFFPSQNMEVRENRAWELKDESQIWDSLSLPPTWDRLCTRSLLPRWPPAFSVGCGNPPNTSTRVQTVPFFSPHHWDFGFKAYAAEPSSLKHRIIRSQPIRGTQRTDGAVSQGDNNRAGHLPPCRLCHPVFSSHTDGLFH